MNNPTRSWRIGPRAKLMIFVSLISSYSAAWTQRLDICLRTWTILTPGVVSLGVLRTRQRNVGSHVRAAVGTCLGLAAAFLTVFSFRTRRVPFWPTTHSRPPIAIVIVAFVGIFVGSMAISTHGSRHTAASAPMCT